MSDSIKNKYHTSISTLGLVALSLFVFTACEQQDKHAEGKKLAQIHCASCHMFPEPSTLPRKVWGDNILPNMGLLMGMSHGPIYTYGDSETTNGLKPSMSQEDWDKIVHYYLNLSQKEIPKYEVKKQESNDFFKPYVFSIDSIPLITMTVFDHKSQNLLLGDANSSSLLRLDMKGNMLDSNILETPPVKTVFTDSLDYVLTIGSVSPSDEATGKLEMGSYSIEKLTRPVDFLINDIDADGYDDIFICNYGNNTGDFSLYKNLGDNTFEKRIIHPLSGAIKVQLANIDNDDENELVVMFAQEHELIMVWDYENDSFVGKKVIQFQPAFGSVDFELNDMNGDGLIDIVIGNGDNSDFSTVLKGFHGVRVLLNQGDKEFIESYFWPMHGVSKLRTEDFDLDGDIDIVAISNFGDFSNPLFKSVQLLLNQGEMKFQPEYIYGMPNFRWQTLDLADYDKDGDTDVFIGSFNWNAGPKESDISEKKYVSWVRLENKTN